MSERSTAIFEIAETPRQTMRIFGTDYEVVNAATLNAMDAAKLQMAGRELQAMGDGEEFDELQAKRLDGLVDRCITVILPSLPASELARIGFMQRVGLLQAFTEASSWSGQPTPQPLPQRHPNKPSSSTKSRTSSATTAAVSKTG